MFKKILKSYDYTLIGSILLLSLFGLIMVYSSSMIVSVMRYETDVDFFFQRQRLFLLAGILVFLVTMFIPYKLYSKPAILKSIVLGTFILLILVYIYGHTSNNAQSWIKIGPFSIQPSEFAKMSVILYLSAVYSRKQAYIHDFKNAVLPPIAFMAMVTFIVLIQPDFGTAFIIVLLSLSIILCSGISLFNLTRLGILGAGIVSFVLLIITAIGKFDDVFSDERISRFTGFLDPFNNLQGSGYQLINSYIAMGNGGLSGTGLGQSTQKYGYLPEPHTDFIISVIAEELGIIGVFIVLFLMGFIVVKGFLAAKNAKDKFGHLLAIGISSMITIQTVVNMGGATGLLPITGVTLPFISYGGSSLVILMASVGVLVNISMINRLQYRK